MKIQQIQPQTTFKSRRGSLSIEVHESLKEIIGKMKKESFYKATEGDRYDTHILSRLEVFKDDKPLAQIQSMKTIYTKDCFNDNIEQIKLSIKGRNIDIQTYEGDYYAESKPFFKSWKSFIKNIEEVICFVKTNYDNKNIVKKRFLDKSNVKYYS